MRLVADLKRAAEGSQQWRCRADARPPSPGLSPPAMSTGLTLEVDDLENLDEASGSEGSSERGREDSEDSDREDSDREDSDQESDDDEYFCDRCEKRRETPGANRR